MRRAFVRLLVSGALFLPVAASFLLSGPLVPQARSAAPAAGGVTVKSIRGKCGMCHREIAQEWLNSLHANAFRDVHFIAEAANVPEA